eukprot:scaffold1156_cov394-Prasinococcus_capsulatus_cf.AAC.2
MLVDALLDEKPLEPVKRAAPFLQKTYDMIDEESTNETVSWADHGRSFIVWRPEVLQSTLLPKFFKHNNYSSFVRQLNTYGFRKMNPERWEFAQPDFIRGQRGRLINIVRKRSAKSGGARNTAEGDDAAVVPLGNQRQTAVEVGNYGSMSSDLERVKRDNSILTMEILKLRQQQQRQQQQMDLMQQRLMSTESTQMQMMNAFQQAVENPELFHELLQRLNSSGLGAEQRRKRRAIRNTEEPAAMDMMQSPRAPQLMTNDAPTSSATRLQEIISDSTEGGDAHAPTSGEPHSTLFEPDSPPHIPFDDDTGDNPVGGSPSDAQNVALPSAMTSTETAEQAMLHALLDGFSLEEPRMNQ